MSMDFIVQISSGSSQDAPLMVPLTLTDYDEWDRVMPYMSGNDLMCALVGPYRTLKSEVLAVWRASVDDPLYDVYIKYTRITLAEFAACVVDAGQRYFNISERYSDDVRRSLGLPVAPAEGPAAKAWTRWTSTSSPCATSWGGIPRSATPASRA